MKINFIFDVIICMYLGKIAWIDFKTLKIKNKSLLYLLIILIIRLVVLNIDLKKVFYFIIIKFDYF